MSLKDEIRAELLDLNVKSVTVDRDSNLHGRPAIEVKVGLEVDHDGVPVYTEHVLQFAKDNNMDAAHMAAVVDSYVRSGIDEVMA